MSRGASRVYWSDQLAEYWDSGFSIHEYCELKDLSFENTKRWIRVFEKERNGVTEKRVPAVVEIPEPVCRGEDRQGACRRKRHGNGVVQRTQNRASDFGEAGKGVL